MFIVHGRARQDAHRCRNLRFSEDKQGTKLGQLKKAAQTANLKSLDEVIADEDGLTVGETVMDPCDHYSDLLDEIQDEALSAILREMLDDLPVCQGEVLRLHYYDRLPLTEISRRIDGPYLADHPDVFVTQMDTVYNDGSNDPFLQTFKFVRAGVLFAIYHEEKTALTMKDGVDLLGIYPWEEPVPQICPCPAYRSGW